MHQLAFDLRQSDPNSLRFALSYFSKLLPSRAHFSKLLPSRAYLSGSKFLSSGSGSPTTAPASSLPVSGPRAMPHMP